MPLVPQLSSPARLSRGPVFLNSVRLTFASGHRTPLLPLRQALPTPLGGFQQHRRKPPKPRERLTECASSRAPGKDAASTAGEGSLPPKAVQQPKLAAAKEAPKAGPTSTASFNSEPGLRMFHLAMFFVVLAAGLLFLAALLYINGDMQFQSACAKVLKRLMKTVAIRQTMGIFAAMVLVRAGLEPLVKFMRQVFRAQGPWEKSTEYYVLREVYRPLEVLFVIACVTSFAENFLPQLISLPKALVQSFVRATLSLTFVISAARVVFSVKARMAREQAWQLELKGDLTRQRRVEAIDKLLSVLTLLVSGVFALQAIGLDVNSVLAIGGVGGLAVGLAGREILENLFTGLIILSSSPFEVGDEVLFTPPSGQTVEGIVVDVGWYRTLIRSFERESFNIPNSVFSRNVVLNITRKQREWRFYEFIGLRVEDVGKAAAVIADMRKIIRQDPRIIQKLHRRVFLDKLTREHISLYISFYVEAANRDAFMAVKQDLLLAFIDCVERNNAKLARPRVQVEVVAMGIASSSARAASAGEGVRAALPEGSLPPADQQPGMPMDPAPGTAMAGSAAGSPEASTSASAGSAAPSSNNVVPRSDPLRAAVVAAAKAYGIAATVDEAVGDPEGRPGLVTASFEDIPDSRMGYSSI